MDIGKPEHRRETENLIAAAKRLVSPEKQINTDSVNQQLTELFGDQAPACNVAKPKPFLVLQENWPAIQLFLACQTQWHHLATMSSVIKTGLDYTAVKTVMELRFSSHNQAELFTKLQIIESQALTAFNNK